MEGVQGDVSAQGKESALRACVDDFLKTKTMQAFLPIFALVEEKMGVWQAVVEGWMCQIVPLYHFREMTAGPEGEWTVEGILAAEAKEHVGSGSDDLEGSGGLAADGLEGSDSLDGLDEAQLEALLRAENDAARDKVASQDPTAQGGTGADSTLQGGLGGPSGTGVQSGEDGQDGTGVQSGEEGQNRTDGQGGTGADGAAQGGAGAEGAPSLFASGFVPHAQPLAQVDLEGLKDYETLVETFYTIDSSTMIGSDQLDVEKLAGKDLSISKDGEGPQILIYHTHSQEAFADSVPGERSDTIVGVGDYLAQLLTQVYGYQVLHHDGAYDVPNRDNAYSVALPAIEAILKQNPGIQVVIDLHRDAMDEGTRLVTELDGRPTARFMFFNGLSRTRKTGDISYLYNENLDDNLAFSFQLQKKAMEYYPGLTRRIYLKAYRYNMHLRPRNLLIELGAQNNTVEEAKNACEPLAHLLDLVLSGQN